MRKLLSKSLLLVVSTSVFAAPDDYQKKSTDGYGDGTLKTIAKEIGPVFKEANTIFALDHKVEIQVRDIDGQETTKIIRYAVDGFVGPNEQYAYYGYRDKKSDRSGALPFTLSLTAEDGSDITVEEARLALIQLQDKQVGVTFQILEYAKDTGASFMTEAIQDMRTFDILNIRLSDAVHTFENGNMVTFNGFVRAGWVSDLESYGTSAGGSLSDTTRIEYGTAVGMKFRNLIMGDVDVTPEVFNRTVNFNKASDFEVSRTGFQVNFETSFSERLGCSAALGFADEEVDGQFNESNEEIYVSTKCEF